MFYIIIITIFPVSLGYRINILDVVAIPIICVGFFITTLHALDNLFLEDRNNGLLFKYNFLSVITINTIVLIKLLTKCASLSLCIGIGTAIAFIFYGIEYTIYIPVLYVIILSVSMLVFVGSLGAALLVGYKEKGVLLSLMIMPFYIPMLVYILNIFNNIVAGFPIYKQMCVLIILFGLLLLVVPIACVYILKIWSE